MAQRKLHPVWTNVERTTFDALQRYLRDTNMGVSEFVREIIIAKLLDEHYLEQDQLEELVLGR